MRPRPVRSALALSVLVACAPASPAPAQVPAPSPPLAPAPTASTAPPPAASAVPMLTAPPPPLGADHVTFSLHKILAEVGTEVDTYVALPDGGTEAKAVFSYRDRRVTVPLAARFDFGPDGSLRSYAAWGSTSRHSSIDDRVDARGPAWEVSHAGKTSLVRPEGLAVAVSGYAPMMAQDLMVRAWSEHGRPATMAMLPEGEVAITSRGKESYDGEKNKVTLEHLVVTGLIWGREDLWIDDKGQLAATVTIDAEGDAHEAAREGFVHLVPKLVAAAGADGVAWLATAAKGAERGGTGVQAYVGGNLIDGTGRAAVTDSVVIVDGDRIVAAGPRGKIAIPANATSIDVTGKSIIPGLWDMHAHVQQVELGVAHLAAGVTTVRDMGNVLEFITGMRDAIDAGKGLGPRILVEGIVDGGGEGGIGVNRISRREEIAPVIDRYKKAGCVDVKLYSSLDPALVRPIVAYAHAHGMRALGHVPRGMTSQQAIDAGYDSISHIRYLFDAALPDSATKGRSPEARNNLFAAVDLSAKPMTTEVASLLAHHVVVDDTLALFEQMMHTREEDAKREPGIDTLPRELRATLGGVPPALADSAGAAFSKHLALLAELHKRGVVLVAGTDIAVPGYSLLRELELYVQAGFTPMEAIRAATIVPARFMHLEKELGTIEKGKGADFVILNADPLADVSNVRRTFLVVARGHAYDPAALWKLVGFHPRT